ncbi:unnamed protein product [Citrullus colocynthis]|uniref:Uncharacterized protein n=1 Tax=Citrullus colocynthis TaxID=252529 RepID=A0ABP0YI46_9ROSI
MATTVANFTLAHHPIIFAAVETLSAVRSPVDLRLFGNAVQIPSRKGNRFEVASSKASKVSNISPKKTSFPN